MSDTSGPESPRQSDDDMEQSLHSPDNEEEAVVSDDDMSGDLSSPRSPSSPSASNLLSPGTTRVLGSLVSAGSTLVGSRLMSPQQELLSPRSLLGANPSPAKVARRRVLVGPAPKSDWSVRVEANNERLVATYDKRLASNVLQYAIYPGQVRICPMCYVPCVT